MNADRHHFTEGIENQIPEAHLYPLPALSALAEKRFGEGLKWQNVAGDSTSKVLWRITHSTGTAIGIDASGLEWYRKKENRAFERIGRHLRAAGLPVPDIFAAHPDEGIFIIEDLGDNRLSEAVGQMDPKTCIETYRKVIRVLVDLQFKGFAGFDTKWCSQTKRYDTSTILRYESTYFTDRFVNEYLCVPTDAPDLIDEFHQLAEHAAKCQPQVFLHRDFQSHNILIKRGQIRIIDFQGGRLGPAGYDLASLLIDPFTGLSPEMQTLLLEEYIEMAGKYGWPLSDAFRRDYEYLALHRNFQILGAFAWLTKVKQKNDYRAYIPQMLDMLKTRIANPVFDSYPIIRNLVLRLSIN